MRLLKSRLCVMSNLLRKALINTRACNNTNTNTNPTISLRVSCAGSTSSTNFCEKTAITMPSTERTIPMTTLAVSIPASSRSRFFSHCCFRWRISDFRVNFSVGSNNRHFLVQISPSFSGAYNSTPLAGSPITNCPFSNP